MLNFLLIYKGKIQSMAYKRKCNDSYNRKKVIQFSLNGKKLKEWTTVGEIFRELGFDKSAILRCCKGKQKKSYHFIWKFEDDHKNELINIAPNIMKNASDNKNSSETFSGIEEKNNA